MWDRKAFTAGGGGGAGEGFLGNVTCETNKHIN